MGKGRGLQPGCVHYDRSSEYLGRSRRGRFLEVHESYFETVHWSQWFVTGSDVCLLLLVTKPGCKAGCSKALVSLWSVGLAGTVLVDGAFAMRL